MFVMKKNEILFSIIFLIMAFYIITKEGFLSQISTRDMVFHITLTLLAFAVAISNIVDLRKLRTREFKYKVIPLLCITSSLIFIVATVYSMFLF